MLIEDIGNAARYGHSWAPVRRAASWPTNRSGGSKNKRTSGLADTTAASAPTATW